jgi:hypothetical protein
MPQVKNEPIESQAFADAAIYQLRSSLQIVVDFDAAVEEIEYRFQLGASIAQSSKLFLEGKISGADFFDLAEQSGINIDQYAEEVEENLENIGFLR